MTERSGTVTGGGVDLCYDEFGDREKPTVLLIMGLGAQMVYWPVDFCEQIASAGYHVVRFDNRDIGLSTKFDGARVRGLPMPVKLLQFFVGLPVGGSPYSLTDLANDAVRVLDHLNIEQAHIVGASMGGMITQIIAADHGNRALSASIIMSSNNRPLLPPPGARQLLAIMSPPPKDAGRDALIAKAIATGRSIGSPVYPADPAVALERATEYLDRSYYPAGPVRQFAAILASGRLDRFNRRTRVPTLVLHGTHDKLMRPAGARAVASTIPNARLVMVDGMAHDLPQPLWGEIVDTLTSHFAG